MKNKPKRSKADVASILRLVVLGTIGLGLSVLFLWLHSNFNNTIVTIITAILSPTYMVGCVAFINKKESIYQSTLKASVAFPLGYITIVFTLLFALFFDVIKENTIMLLDCFLWSIYTMPAFIVVMVIVFLIMLLFGTGA